MDKKHLIALPSLLLVGIIRLYQRMVSPFLGSNCRFHPSCSNYCIEALREHGMVRGLWLGMKRISKCHPFHSGGYDPVPPSKNKSTRRKPE
jgi:putative membrane protein insertion efficiency factor